MGPAWRAALLCVLVALAEARVHIVNLAPHDRYVETSPGQYERQVVNTLTVSCNNGDRELLSTALGSLDNVTLPFNNSEAVNIIVDCGDIVATYDAKPVTRVPVVAGVMVVSSDVTTDIGLHSARALAVQRLKAANQTEAGGARRKRFGFDPLSFGIAVGAAATAGVALGIASSANNAIFDTEADASQARNLGFDGCATRLETVYGTAGVNDCLFELINKTSSFQEILNEMALIQQMLLDSVDALFSAVETLSAQLNAVNARLSIVEESVDQLRSDVLKLVEFSQKALVTIEQNALNQAVTTQQLAIAQQTQSRNNQNTRTALSQTNQAIEDASLTYAGVIEDLQDQIETQFDLGIQQVYENVFTVFSEFQNDVSFMMQDLGVRTSSIAEQSESHLNSLGSSVNRLAAEQARNYEFHDDVVETLSQMTRLIFSREELVLAYWRSLTVVKQHMGMIPFLRDEGVPPQNATDWNFIGARVIEAARRTVIDVNGTAGAGCPAVLTDAVPALDAYYSELALDWSVPLLQDKNYLRYGDAVQIVIEGAPLVTDCSGALPCQDCTLQGAPLAAADPLCTSPTAHLSPSRTFRIVDSFANATTELVRNFDVVAFQQLPDTFQRYVYYTDAGTLCYVDHSLLSAVNETAALFLIVAVGDIDPVNLPAQRPYIHRAHTVRLVPLLAPTVALGLAGPPTAEVCAEGSATGNVTVLDNSADPALRRRAPPPPPPARRDPPPPDHFCLNHAELFAAAGYGTSPHSVEDFEAFTVGKPTCLGGDCMLASVPIPAGVYVSVYKCASDTPNAAYEFRPIGYSFKPTLHPCTQGPSVDLYWLNVIVPRGMMFTVYNKWVSDSGMEDGYGQAVIRNPGDSPYDAVLVTVALGGEGLADEGFWAVEVARDNRGPAAPPRYMARCIPRLVNSVDLYPTTCGSFPQTDYPAVDFLREFLLDRYDAMSDTYSLYFVQAGGVGASGIFYTCPDDNSCVSAPGNNYTEFSGIFVFKAPGSGDGSELGAQPETLYTSYAGATVPTELVAAPDNTQYRYPPTTFAARLGTCSIWCEDVPDRLTCTTYFAGVCVWLYDPVLDRNTCHTAASAGVSFPDCLSYGTRSECVFNTTDDQHLHCAWSRSAGACEYYDRQYSSMISHVLPCGLRLLAFNSPFACVPGIDATRAHAGESWDECVFLRNPHDTLGEYPACERVVFPDEPGSNTEVCFDRGVECEFGFTPPGQAPDKRDLFYDTFWQWPFDNPGARNIGDGDSCAVFNSPHLDDCTLKSRDGAGGSFCEVRNNQCTRRCALLTEPLACIDEPFFGKCLWINSTGTCTENSVNVEDQPFCRTPPYNCATARERCNVYAADRAGCIADGECTWMFFDTEATGKTPYCERKTRVNVADCRFANGTVLDECDGALLGSLSKAANRLKKECVIPDANATTCTEAFDPVTGLHCVFLRVGAGSFGFCLPPGDGRIQNLQSRYQGIASTQLITYQEGGAPPDTATVYANRTFTWIRDNVLRADAHAHPLGHLREAGVRVVPDRTDTFFACETPGYEPVGYVCCLNVSVIQVNVNGRVVAQCAEGGDSYPNPRHPFNVYQEVATAICLDSAGTAAYAEWQPAELTLYYYCKLEPDDGVLTDDFCPELNETSSTASESIHCYPYITYQDCLDFQICARLAERQCEIHVALEDVPLHLVRLSAAAMNQLADSLSYTLYNNTLFTLSDMVNVTSYRLGREQDIFWNNVTESIFVLFPTIADIDIQTLLRVLEAFYGAHYPAWGASLGEGVSSTTQTFTRRDGRHLIQSHVASYGYHSADTEPVYVYKHPRASCTARILKLDPETQAVESVLASGVCNPSNPFGNQLPTENELFLHRTDEARGLVMSPPGDVIRVSGPLTTRLGHIGCFHTFGNASIGYDAFVDRESRLLRLKPELAVQCFQVSPMQYSSFLDPDDPWCGRVYGGSFEASSSVEGLLNLRYLAYLNITAPNESGDGPHPAGLTLDRYWNETLGSYPGAPQDVRTFLLAVDDQWQRRGCPNAFTNFVEADYVVYEPGTNGSVVAYGRDMARVFYDAFAAYLAANGSFAQAVEDVADALMQPIIDAGDSVQCGNCDGGGPEPCAFPVQVRAVDSVNSARYGLCELSRRYAIDWDRPGELISFTLTPASGSMVVSFEVDFDSIRQILAPSVCPTFPNGFATTDCSDFGTKCTLDMFNPRTDANIIARIVVTAAGCPGVTEVAIPPRRAVQHVINTCDGGVNVNVTTFDGAPCLHFSTNINVTQTFTSLFSDSIVHIAAQVIQSDFAPQFESLVQTYVEGELTDVVFQISDLEIHVLNNNLAMANFQSQFEAFRQNISFHVDAITPQLAVFVDNLGNFSVRLDDFFIDLHDAINRTNAQTEIIRNLRDELDGIETGILQDMDEFANRSFAAEQAIVSLQTQFANESAVVRELLNATQEAIDHLFDLLDAVPWGGATSSASATAVAAIISAVVGMLFGVAGTVLGIVALVRVGGAAAGAAATGGASEAAAVAQNLQQSLADNPNITAAEAIRRLPPEQQDLVTEKDVAEFLNESRNASGAASPPTETAPLMPRPGIPPFIPPIEPPVRVVSLSALRALMERRS